MSSPTSYACNCGSRRQLRSPSIITINGRLLHWSTNKGLKLGGINPRKISPVATHGHILLVIIKGETFLSSSVVLLHKISSTFTFALIFRWKLHPMPPPKAKAEKPFVLKKSHRRLFLCCFVRASRPLTPRLALPPRQCRLLGMATMALSKGPHLEGPMILYIFIHYLLIVVLSSADRPAQKKAIAEGKRTRNTDNTTPAIDLSLKNNY